jgi:glucose-1-phosphatase
VIPGEVPTPFDVVLFDLGGVLVDLSGLDAFLDRHRLERDAFWRQWLGTGAVGDFERGGCDADAFADTFLAAFDLSITPDQFLDEFARWPGGLLPGAAEVVRAVPVRTATLSNTNAIHWDGAFTRDELLTLFDDHFPSFRLGLAKPDEAIFARVVELLGVPAARVVFLDDNQVNVDAARQVGLVAHRAVGPIEARRVLSELNVLA